MGKKYRLYILLAVMCLPLLYIVVQTYNAFNRTYTVQIAMRETIEVTVAFEGIAVREEYAISHSGSGLMSYALNQGERVAEYGRVAVEYASAEQAAATAQMEVLNRNIAALENAQNTSKALGANLDTLLSQVQNATYTLVAALDTGEYSRVAELEENLAYYTNCMQIATGELEDLSEQISILKAQQAELSAHVGTPVGYVYAHGAGYFFNTGDGYTEALKYKDIQSVSPLQLKELLGTPVPEAPETQIGGVQTSYGWRFYITFTEAQHQLFKKGAALKVSFENAAAKGLDATVGQIAFDEETGMGWAELLIENTNAGTVGLRVCTVHITFGNHTGLLVSKTALHYIEGVKGVYVRRGNAVIFKPVNPIYEDALYMLLPLEMSDENQVEQYDEIILTGKDLYDGKIL